MSNILIIDIGNSLIKISLSNLANLQIKKTYLFGTRKFLEWSNDIKELLFKLDYSKIIIGSVVPSLNSKIIKLFPKKKEFYFIQNNDFHEIKFNEKYDINEIGIDILSFAYYIKEQSKDCVGISFGTAIFSIIIKNKVVMGISIFPSIIKAYQDLKKRTELINEVEINNIKIDFGFNTKESIESGYYHIINGMLSSIFNYANSKYKINDIFISGGNYKDIDKFKFDKKFKINLDEEQIVSLGYLLLYKNLIN